MARQRKHTVRRRRRGRFRVFYKLLSILLVTVAVVAACLVFFRVNTVTVEGNDRYTAQEVVEASAIQVGDNLIALSKSQVASRIRTQLPYVESVSIRRQFPDGVTLTVKERSAAASVPSSDGRWLISAQGKVLEREQGHKVVKVNGVQAVTPFAGGTLQVEEEEKVTLGYVLALLTALEEQGLLDQCTELDCTSDVSMTLKYSIYELKLPRGADYQRIIRLLLAALDNERMPQGVPGVFDFTVKEGEVYFQIAS